MTSLPEQPSTPPPSATQQNGMQTLFAAPVQASPFAGRDRVLLYTRGTSLSPIQGLELALESLQQAGENAPPEQVMRQMFAQFDYRGISPDLKAPDGERLVSAPPMRRRTVVPEHFEVFSIKKNIIRFLQGIFSRSKKKESGK